MSGFRTSDFRLVTDGLGYPEGPVYRSDGSVLVADTTQGKWFLFGGTICAAAGAVISFAKWTRPRQRRTLG